MRAFIGIPVPMAAAQILHGALKSLKDRHPDLKWVPVENYHITLNFLGNVDNNALDRVCELLDSLPRLKASRVRVDRIGQFPKKGSVKAVVAELKEGRELCVHVYDLIAGALPEYADRRGYVPHVTLARARRNNRAQSFERDYPLSGVDFYASRLVLFESILRPEGPTYRPVHHVKFS